MYVRAREARTAVSLFNPIGWPTPPTVTTKGQAQRARRSMGGDSREASSFVAPIMKGTGTTRRFATAE